MTKAMTVAEKRRAKKVHAKFMAAQAIAPQAEVAPQPCATPVQPRLKPTREARAQARYEEVTADAKGGKHYRRKVACLLDALEANGTISRQRCEAGKRYEVDHRLVWHTSGRDSTIPPVGGISHETQAQAEAIVRAKDRMNRILNMVGPAAFTLLRRVAAYEQKLGRQDSKERVAQYDALKLALDAAAVVYGVPNYADQKRGA